MANQLLDQLETYVRQELGYPGPELTRDRLQGFLDSQDGKVEAARTLLTEYVEHQRFMAQNPQRFQKMPAEKRQKINDLMVEGLVNYDVSGHPVHYLLFSQVDMDRFIQALNVDDLIDYIVCWYELLTRVVFPLASTRLGRPVSKLTLVIDLKDVSPFAFVKGKPSEFLKRFLETIQKFYPGILHKVYIINVSMMFSVLWTFVKPFLHKQTIANTLILKDDFLKKMSLQVPLDRIPRVLGGSFDGNIRENPGPWQPELNQAFQIQSWDLKEIRDSLPQPKAPTPPTEVSGDPLASGKPEPQPTEEPDHEVLEDEFEITDAKLDLIKEMSGDEFPLVLEIKKSLDMSKSKAKS